MREYVFKEPMHYRLVRDRDGKGNSGPILFSFGSSKEDSRGNVIRVGYGVEVGSFTSTYSDARWMTTAVTNIHSAEEDEEGKIIVRFSTENSDYTLVGT